MLDGNLLMKKVQALNSLKNLRPEKEKLGNVLLFHTLVYSTIGDEGLNCWVRDGIRCLSFSMVTKKDCRKNVFHWYEMALEEFSHFLTAQFLALVFSLFIIIDLIPTSKDYADNEKNKMIKPMDSLVLVSSTYCYAYTPNLSTLSSSGSLIGIPYLEGGLAFRCFQRLSFPNIATRLCTWQYNRHTIGSSTSVLSY